MSGSEKINLHSQLEKKQVELELEVSVGQGEQTCMHDMTSSRGDEQPARGAYPARERRKIPLLTMR